MSKRIEIDGIPCIATRDPNGVSYAKWHIVEESTGRLMMPPSWNPSYRADTLSNAICLVQHEFIDKHGKDKILQRIKEIKETHEGESFQIPLPK